MLNIYCDKKKVKQSACLVSLIYMYEHGHHKKKTFI